MRINQPIEPTMTEEEINQLTARVSTARKAIVVDLIKRHNDGDKTVKLNRDRSPTFIAGQGMIPCPVCTTGELHYARSYYNGHVHAGCTTEGCVRFME